MSVVTIKSVRRTFVDFTDVLETDGKHASADGGVGVTTWPLCSFRQDEEHSSVAEEDTAASGSAIDSSTEVEYSVDDFDVASVEFAEQTLDPWTFGSEWQSLSAYEAPPLLPPTLPLELRGGSAAFCAPNLAAAPVVSPFQASAASPYMCVQVVWNAVACERAPPAAAACDAASAPAPALAPVQRWSLSPASCHAAHCAEQALQPAPVRVPMEQQAPSPPSGHQVHSAQQAPQRVQAPAQEPASSPRSCHKVHSAQQAQQPLPAQQQTPLPGSSHEVPSAQHAWQPEASGRLADRRMPAKPRKEAALGAHAAAKSKQDYRTTVMLRNLPNDYSRAMLIQLVDANGFAGQYDFMYLPMDFATQSNIGYAFINLVNRVEAKRFWQVFDGFSRWGLRSRKVCSLSWSDPCQGLQANIRRYRNSPIMREAVPEEYKPALFSGGVQVAFPAPTKTLRAPALSAPFP